MLVVALRRSLIIYVFISCICRWCRTYFLHRGRTAAAVDVSDDLFVDNDDSDGDGDHYGGESKHRELAAARGMEVERGVAASVERLEGLYVKLLLGLRLVVKIAFARHSDVLEAGTEVQVRPLL